MIAGCVLAALVATAVLAGRHGRPWALLLWVTSGVWLVVNQPVEGPVLYTVTSGHGLTGADLAGLSA